MSGVQDGGEEAQDADEELDCGDDPVWGGVKVREPLKESIRVPPRAGHSGEKCPIQAGHFARVPVGILLDRQLSDRAVRVYGTIARTAFSGPRVEVGIRGIGLSLGIGKTSIARAIQQLVAAGHLRRVETVKGRRAVYELTSPIFSSSAPEKSVRSVPTLNTCGRCGKRRRVNRTGYCDACRIAVEVDRKMARWA